MGELALRLMQLIIQKENLIYYSDTTEEELQKIYSEKEIKNMFSIIPKGLLIKLEDSEEQTKEARYLSKKLKIPMKDVLHAIFARDNNTILISRDKHFYELQDQVVIKKPEELI